MQKTGHEITRRRKAKPPSTHVHVMMCKQSLSTCNHMFYGNPLVQRVKLDLIWFDTRAIATGFCHSDGVT